MFSRSSTSSDMGYLLIALRTWVICSQFGQAADRDHALSPPRDISSPEHGASCTTRILTAAVLARVPSTPQRMFANTGAGGSPCLPPLASPRGDACALVTIEAPFGGLVCTGPDRRHQAPGSGRA